MKRAETWPEEDQRKLLQAALMIENQHNSAFELTPDDWAIIDARVANSRKQGLATDEEANALFAKYHQS